MLETIVISQNIRFHLPASRQICKQLFRIRRIVRTSIESGNATLSSDVYSTAHKIDMPRYNVYMTIEGNESETECVHKSDETLVSGNRIEEGSYVPEEKELGSGCGPACILMAYNILNNEGKKDIIDLRNLIESVDRRQPHDVIGRTNKSDRDFIVEELNKGLEQKMRLERLTIKQSELSPDLITQKIDSSIELGKVVMVGVGENYLFEILKSEIPPSEIEAINFLLNDLQDIDKVMEENFSFEGFYEKINEIQKKYGSQIHEHARFYIAMSLSRNKDRSRQYWTLEQEEKYSEKLRKNVISKIIPPQNILEINIAEGRKKLGIPDEGFPVDSEHKSIPPRPLHAILVHGIVNDGTEEGGYLISDPIESFGPNRILNKRAFFNSLLSGRRKINLEILSKE